MDEALAIAGRVAIVTGAGNGLGRAESLALARAGALLVLNDLPGDAVQAVADEIAADGGQAVVAAGDVAEWSTGEKLLATALEQYGRLDIVVNNAGVLRDRMVFTMSPDEWDLVIRVHLRGHFVTTRLATAYWRGQRKAGGHPGYTRIVNTSFAAVLRPPQRHLPPRPHRDDRRADGPGARGRGRPARAGARRAVGGIPGRPRGRGDQRRGVRGARRRGRGDGAATSPFGIPGLGYAGRDVDAGFGGGRPRSRVRGSGTLGRVPV